MYGLVKVEGFSGPCEGSPKFGLEPVGLLGRQVGEHRLDGLTRRSILVVTVVAAVFRTRLIEARC